MEVNGESQWPMGRTIRMIRELTPAEKVREGWSQGEPCECVELDDGTILYASRDAEGNGPGELFGIDPAGNAVMLNVAP